MLCQELGSADIFMAVCMRTVLCVLCVRPHGMTEQSNSVCVGQPATQPGAGNLSPAEFAAACLLQRGNSNRSRCGDGPKQAAADCLSSRQAEPICQWHSSQQLGREVESLRPGICAGLSRTGCSSEENQCLFMFQWQRQRMAMSPCRQSVPARLRREHVVGCD